MAKSSPRRSKASRPRWPAFLSDGVFLRRAAIVVLALGLFGGVTLMGAWWRACAGNNCPAIGTLTSYDPDQASKVYAADGRLITDFGEQRRTVIELDSMAPAVPAAFLAVEDKRFYDHSGVDWVRFFGAVKTNILAMGVQEGYSTITMQLAGNIFPEEIDRSQRGGLSGIARKIRETKVSLQIEDRYSKDKILELYLNQIALGNRAFGVESASLRYFGKHASEVNVAEAAMLAALPKGPTKYDPRRNPDLAVQRRNLVLSLMADNGSLSREEAESWKAYPLSLSSRSDYSGVGEYFIEYVRQQMTAIFGSGLYEEGYRIYTTIDLDAQAAAERALSAQLERIESGALGPYKHTTYREYLEQDGSGGRSDSPYLQGAVVVMEARTGNILAMVGGRDFQDSKFNRAVQAQRQPGSTFKPIVYSAALERGIPLHRVEVDEPISVPMPDGQPNWEPSNYDNRFSLSSMTLREALWKSTNSIAVKIGLELGAHAVAEEARKFGITGHIPTVPSLMLGSLTVPPIEMVAAYSVFANLGTRVEPNAILRVEDRDGNRKWEPTPVRRRVLDEGTAWMITDALQGVVTRGTAYNSVYNAGFKIPSGGKTGTTNDYHDVWYIGFTNDLVAGVWMGFDRLKPIKSNAQGGLLAAPAYTQMMREIYQRRATPPGWAEPENLRQPVEIDRSTGYLATPFCPQDVREIRHYPPGGAPKDYCPIHSPFPAGDTD